MSDEQIELTPEEAVDYREIAKKDLAGARITLVLYERPDGDRFFALFGYGTMAVFRP